MGPFYARPVLLAIVLITTLAAGVARAQPVVCVIVPHFKDEYWLSVGFGLKTVAETEGAGLRIFESGGYHSLDRQIELLDECVRSGSDAILLGAVSATDPKLLAAVARAQETVPVLALVNELDAPDLAAWIGVDWRGMGEAVAQYLGDLARDQGEPVRAVLITGPDASGWGAILDEGIARSLDGRSVQIVATYRADTGLREQLREVERALDEHPDIDVLIGSAPAIEGAMGLSRRLPATAHHPRLVATYISHSVLRGLKSGAIAMVPFDDPIDQGRLGVELALRAAQGDRFPGLSGPRIRTIVSGNPEIEQIRLSPSGYFPALH